MYPKLFCVTCLAYLLHNCATKVKSLFEDVDQQIARVKSATIKNKTRQAKFSTVSCPPQPIIRRWGNWLNTALNYAKNLPEVKAIVKNFEGFGILVTLTKVSFETTGLATRLLKIKDQYECLVKLKETIEVPSTPSKKRCKKYKNLTSEKTLAAFAVIF